MEDLITTIPFGNQVEGIEVPGQTILDALDNSIARYDLEQPPGRFLQFSGRDYH